MWTYISDWNPIELVSNSSRLPIDFPVTTCWIPIQILCSSFRFPIQILLNAFLILHWLLFSSLWFPFDVLSSACWLATDFRLISHWLPTDSQSNSYWHPACSMLMSYWIPTDFLLNSGWFPISLKIVMEHISVTRTQINLSRIRVCLSVSVTRGVHRRLCHLLQNAADQAQGVMRWVTLQLVALYNAASDTRATYLRFADPTSVKGKLRF